MSAGTESEAMNASDGTPKSEPYSAAEAYRLLFDQSREAVCIVDLEGRLTSVNPACERLTGWTATELVDRFVLDLIPPELREQVTHQFEERLRGDPSPTEIVLVTRDGKRVPVLVTSTLIVDRRPSRGGAGPDHRSHSDQEGSQREGRGRVEPARSGDSLSQLLRVCPDRRGDRLARRACSSR